ncbi:MAG: hypothetical protein ACJ73D_01920, partial [Pyrinomonadaceae bacterium]
RSFLSKINSIKTGYEGEGGKKREQGLFHNLSSSNEFFCESRIKIHKDNLGFWRFIQVLFMAQDGNSTAHSQTPDFNDLLQNRIERKDL